MVARWNRMTTGNPEVDHFQLVAERYLAPRGAKTALSLGCGSGHNERSWAAVYRFERHEGLDISPVSIAEAEKLARNAGMEQLHYAIGDLNSVRLPPAAYDIVFAEQSLHHVAALEHLMAQVQGALKPGGLFVVNEFIGPTRFQWTDRQLEAINGALAILPPCLRRSRVQPDIFKSRVVRPTVAQVIASDPSESVRSAEIPGLLHEYFDVLEWRPYGGALLHLLFEDIAGNFKSDDPAVLGWRDWCFDLEDRLMQAGELKTDFVMVVCQCPA